MLRLSPWIVVGFQFSPCEVIWVNQKNGLFEVGCAGQDDLVM